MVAKFVQPKQLNVNLEVPPGSLPSFRDSSVIPLTILVILQTYKK